MVKSPKKLPDLQNADWLHAPASQLVLAFLGGGDEVRVVGGAVRNHLLGQRVNDIDLATVHSAEEIMSRAKIAGIKAVATGGGHGTVTLIVRNTTGKHVFEVTPLRVDVATDGRRAVVEPTGDWALDAQRRDFTLNALYCDGAGQLYDYVDGYGDVMARKVRFIGAARHRIEEDYLRILRFFRFSAIYANGVLEADGLAASISCRAGISGLSAERVKQELFKILEAPFASDILRKMVDCEIMELVLSGQTDIKSFTRLSVIEDSLNFPARAILRLAILARGNEQLLALWGKRLKLSGKESKRLGELASGVSDFQPNLSETELKRLLYHLGEEKYTQCVLLVWGLADAPSDSLRWLDFLDLPNKWQAPVFPLKGADVLALGVDSGPQIGLILSRLEKDWVEARFSWDNAELQARLKTMLMN